MTACDSQAGGRMSPEIEIEPMIASRVNQNDTQSIARCQCWRHYENLMPWRFAEL